jgi:hypothetical protein
VAPKAGDVEVAAGVVVGDTGAGEPPLPAVGGAVGGTVGGAVGVVVGGTVATVVVERGGWVVGVVRGTVVVGTVLAGRVIGEAMEDRW